MGNLGRLGRYQLIEEIGHGGMGVVYRALDSVIGRLVAIKVIRLHDASDSADREFLRQRLIKEARTAGTLSHPGIVVVHEIGEQDDSAYIVMEHVSGLTVETLMRGKYSLDRGLAGRIVEQTAAALDYAHRRGIVHRDIKPGNLMLNDEGLVKVCDFGIAKIFMGDVSATRTGTVLGTPHYMSPEQLQRKAIDGRTDQYSLAVVAFQMLTGQKPFQAETLETLFFQIIYENPLEVCRRNSILTSGEAEVLARALAKEPAERYESCTKFAGDLLKAGTVAPKAMAAKAAAGAPSVTPAPAPKTESHCVRCGAVAGPGKKYCEFCALFWTDPDEPSPISVELPRTADTSRGRSWLDPLQRVWRRLTAAGSRASSGRTN